MVSAYEQGRTAWPELVVSEADFTTCLPRAAATTDAAEVYLACACATGEAMAIRAFEARYFGCIASIVRRLRLPEDDANEIAQTLRQRLFIGGLETAGVIGYAGGGRLGGLVQVAATRIALNLRRATRRISDEALPEGHGSASDSIYAKQEYREKIKAAIEAAAAALSARDRTLLRLHLVDRASIDDIASTYRVHRATAARWVSAAREMLVAHTRETFLRTGADEPGLASYVESQLDLSLPRLLS